MEPENPAPALWFFLLEWFFKFFYLFYFLIFIFPLTVIMMESFKCAILILVCLQMIWIFCLWQESCETQVRWISVVVWIVNHWYVGSLFCSSTTWAHLFVGLQTSLIPLVVLPESQNIMVWRIFPENKIGILLISAFPTCCYTWHPPAFTRTREETSTKGTYELLGHFTSEYQLLTSSTLFVRFVPFVEAFSSPWAPALGFNPPFHCKNLKAFSPFS